MTRLHHAATTIRDLSPEKHSLAEVLAVLLHRSHLHHDQHNPDWPLRDRVIVASDTLRPAWFAALVSRGLLTEADHHQHRGNSFRLTDRHHRSFSTACHAAVETAEQLQHNNIPAQVYCLIDGEDQRKGALWEAANRASHRQLPNLISIVDCDLTSLEAPSPAPHWSNRWQSFGWQVREVDGHNLIDIDQTLKETRALKQPTVILAYTKGEW